MISRGSWTLEDLRFAESSCQDAYIMSELNPREAVNAVEEGFRTMAQWRAE